MSASKKNTSMITIHVQRLLEVAEYLSPD